MKSQPLELSKERCEPFAVPCGLANVDCPPEIGQPHCRITQEQIKGIGDLSVSNHVGICQLQQRQRAEKDLIPDPNTGLDLLPLMLTKAKARFNHPTRQNEQVSGEEGQGYVSTVLAALVEWNLFRRVNEHGHGFGDQAARKAANFLRGLTRPGDFLGRWGLKSDEFIVLMFGMNKDDSNLIIDRLEQRLMEGIWLATPNGEKLHLTASVGSAFMHDVRSYRQIEQTIDAADKAVMAWKQHREGPPERQYLDGCKSVPSNVPRLLVP